MSCIRINNTGHGKLQVPGFGDIPVDYELPIGERFAHGVMEMHNVAALPGRAGRLTFPEVMMLRVMEQVTDKLNWEHDVFDESITTQWYTDLLSDWRARRYSKPYWDVSIDMDLVTSRMWEWCIMELRDKAVQFQRTGHILILNADSGVCKSDLIGKELQHGLQETFSVLENPSAKRLNSNPIIELLDPSLFQLAYGCSSVFNQGRQVNLFGDEIPFPATSNTHVPPIPGHPEEKVKPEHPRQTIRPYDTTISRTYRWSNRFQWLPCEVSFTGPEGTDVRVTSYINNLHPKHVQAYHMIEKLISMNMRPWNDILVKGRTSRYPLRIKTYGWEESGPNDEYGQMRPDWIRLGLPNSRWSQEKWDAYCVKAKQYLALPEPDQKYRIFDHDPTMWEGPDDLLRAVTPEMWMTHTSTNFEHFPEEERLTDIILLKGLRLHTFKYPEAGISYSYEDWKHGKTVKALIEKTNDESPSPPSEHQYQSVSLQEEFREKGLQVIVRVSSIELTPELPCYEGDNDFHVDGLLNEHVVATSRYYYDIDNVSDGRISFQQQDDLNTSKDRLGKGPMHKIFGLPIERDPDSWSIRWVQGLQTLGSVAAHEDRFLAWANTLRHKCRPFSLNDPTRPGHQRYITLFLVDPHYRICSTQNVPAQQHEWWRESALANMDPLRRMPQEIADLIMDEIGDWPIGITEAERWKSESEKERERSKKWQTLAAEYIL